MITETELDRAWNLGDAHASAGNARIPLFDHDFRKMIQGRPKHEVEGLLRSWLLGYDSMMEEKEVSAACCTE